MYNEVQNDDRGDLGLENSLTVVSGTRVTIGEDWTMGVVLRTMVGVGLLCSVCCVQPAL